MTNPYRAMCAELAEELVNEYGYCTEWEKGLPLCESNVSELLTRARRPQAAELEGAGAGCTGRLCQLPRRCPRKHHPPRTGGP
jgi:hypothetical protein